MQRFLATVRQELHGGEVSLSELVQYSLDMQTVLSVLAVRETIDIPLELKVNGLSRYRDQKTGQIILEFSGVTVTAVEKAFEATSVEPNPLKKPFDLDLDERSDNPR